MSKTRSPRMRKVDALIQEIVAEAVSELTDPDLGFVTITGVDCSPDLRRATVFFSSLGSPEASKASEVALGRATRHVQQVMAKELRTKYTPVIEFQVDTSVEQAVRITGLLGTLTDQSEQESDT